MTNLVLALIYKMYGYANGKAVVIGEGPPSPAALAALGFPWPVGSVLKKVDPMTGQEHFWKILEAEVQQVDV